MIQINSNCFGIIDKKPLKIDSWVNPNIQNITKIKQENKPRSPYAKSDPGATTSNISYENKKYRNVSTAPPSKGNNPPEGNKHNKTQKNPKTPPFRQ
jgi:hypothetical protein